MGLLDVATKKIEWLTNDKWQIGAGTFSPDGKSLTWTADVDGNTYIYLYDVASKHAEALPLKAGREHAGRQSAAVLARWLQAAVLPQRRRRAQRCVGLRHRVEAVAAGDALAGGRAAQHRHG